MDGIEWTDGMIDDEEKGRDSLPRCEKSMSLQQGRSPPTELGKEMERQDFVPQKPGRLASLLLPVPCLPLPSSRLQGDYSTEFRHEIE